ncbi:hypothetical protein PICST_28762 [Scheffersomyces stipitis CBS 6054]|uniref:Required for respiratory growth protein 7, mitochondrial n=1 Tax=Scheffersomyces stipitis (strain ATCC 58785 / CBS 6054 / NBRC 10063 / NRRL Y-11545) TaxID=322104 RepID=A3GGW3_PICST|nr:predicted protein [Scheffersomyces stipitis CBS 6054]EAZ63993.2 hypothetical protein PICST_28762 [Scheffersomyces stipitis CBS 6054]
MWTCLCRFVRPSQLPFPSQIRSLLTNASSIQDYRLYLSHCRRNLIDIDTNIFRGTLYELYVKDFLSANLACFELVKVGGAGDNGVDIRGKWNLDYFQQLQKKKLNSKTNSKQGRSINLKRDIKVLIQCKNVSSKIGAGLIREIIGTYHMNVKSDPPVQNYLFLISKNILTPQAVALADSATIPIIHLRISPLEYGGSDNKDIYDPEHWTGGELVSAYINSQAREYLDGLSMELQMKLIQRKSMLPPIINSGTESKSE